MEEKVQYQSDERLRDVHEVLENCQTRVSYMNDKVSNSVSLKYLFFLSTDPKNGTFISTTVHCWRNWQFKCTCFSCKINQCSVNDTPSCAFINCNCCWHPHAIPENEVSPWTVVSVNINAYYFRFSLQSSCAHDSSFRVIHNICCKNVAWRTWHRISHGSSTERDANREIIIDNFSHKGKNVSFFSPSPILVCSLFSWNREKNGSNSKDEIKIQMAIKIDNAR